jgi:hypothetical protein
MKEEFGMFSIYPETGESAILLKVITTVDVAADYCGNNPEYLRLLLRTGRLQGERK